MAEKSDRLGHLDRFPHSAQSLPFIFLTLHGRVSRRSFWRYGVLALMGMSLYLHAILGIVGVSSTHAEVLINLLLLVPIVAVSAKRWQDRGRSPWWVLIVLVPVVGWLWALLDNGFVGSDPQRNAYGEPPPDLHRTAEP